MKITLSVATSSDHYMDDMTRNRLTLSTQEDWREVYRLRASHQAILIGGETLRRDNPSLGLKFGIEGREPIRVIVSGEGEIPLDSKIFHKGSAPIIILSNIEREELKGVARVIRLEKITPYTIVTQLEKLGIESLFVEGGAKILRLFMESKVVDTLRVATNPSITVDDERAPRFDPAQWCGEMTPRREMFGEMEVSIYEFNRGEIDEEDRELMRRALEVSRNSPPKQSCYRVGSVIKTRSGEIFEGYTLETSPTHHAEQAAIHKALLAKADLKGATIYASMEPCSTRSSEPKSCSELIIEHGLSRALFALYEPSHFVECHGAENMRQVGVTVLYMGEFAKEVLEINRHIFGTPTAE